MADTADAIRVEILATAAQFRTELDSAIRKLAGPGGLKDAVKDIPKQIKVDVQLETAAASSKLGKLRDAIKLTKFEIERDASFGLSTAAAELKLAALDRKVEAEKRKIAETSAAAMIGGGGRGAGGLLSSLPGPIGPVGGGVAAALPVGGAIAGLAGSATAIAGSAAEGLLGAGALGVGGIGILAAGLGSVLAVAKPAVVAIGEVTKAQDALTKATENYGAGSKQARQAQQNLSTVIKEAGPGAAAAAEGVETLGDTWKKLSSPAQLVFFKVLNEGLATAKVLLPTLASIAKTSLEAIRLGLEPVWKMLQSAQFRRILLDLGAAFAKLAPPMIGAFANIFQALGQIAVAAAPFVVEMARGFERMTASWVRSTGPGSAIKGTVATLIGQFKAWLGLGKAVAELLVTIFSAGAGQGKSLVTMLTGIVREWNAWLNTKQGQADMHKFFKESAKLLIQLAEALGPLLKALAELAIKMIPVATALIWLAKELLVTDNIGKAFHGTVKALGAVFSWLVNSPIALLIPGLGEVLLAIKIVHLAVSHFGDAWKAVWGTVKAVFGAVLSFLLGGFSTLLGVIASVLRAADVNLPIVGHIFGKHLGDAAKAVEGAQHSIDSFRSSLAPAAHDSKAKTQTMAQAHQDASQKISDSWGSALSATKKGIGEINRATVAELRILAPKAAGEAGKIASAIGKAIGGGFAGGGYIGAAGERGHDEVPIVVGRGEAVLHAGHQAVVNEALAASGWSGGLAEVFSKTGGLHYNMAGGGFAGGGSGAMGAMVSAANQISSRHYPYVWGGGHGSFAGPYDCSGAVSAVLHAGGFLPAPEVSGQLESFGLPGPGTVTIYANPTHVYMSLGGRFFGTSGQNPGGGAGWFQGAARPGFVVRHVDPSGKAGELGAVGAGTRIATVKAKGVSGATGQIAQAALNQASGAANAMLASIGGGVAGAGAGAFGGPGQPNEPVTASEFGGHNDRSAFGKQTASGKIATDTLWGFAELSDPPGSLNYSALGGLPMGTRIKVGYHGKTITVPKVDVGAGGPGLAGHIRAIDLTYAAARALGAPGLENVSWARMAAGGFAGGGPTATAARVKPRSAGSRSAKTHNRSSQRPPAPGRKRSTSRAPHARSTHVVASTVLDDMPADVLQAARDAANAAGEAQTEEARYNRLLDAQKLVPTDALVTLSDADVAFLDPGSGPWRQSVDAKGQITDSPKLHYQPGDQLVNTGGMVVGRFFTEGGAIAGGAFHAGISTRIAQIAALMDPLGREDRSLKLEQQIGTLIEPREAKAVQQKERRRKRITDFLTRNVARAKRIKAEIAAITTGNLKRNLAQALSKQAIGARQADLRGHLAHLSTELTAERRHQGELIPIEKDPSFMQSLEGQATSVREAIRHEGELARAGGSSASVVKARENLLKNSLRGRLVPIEAENRALGGAPAAVGTGGLIGVLTKQIDAMAADEPHWQTDYKTAGDSIYTVGKVTAELVAEQLALNGTTPIQVRSPGAPAGPSEKDAKLLELQEQISAGLRLALEVSRSQFDVFKGFAPLLQGRLVGSFAQGIDRVARSGPAMVHAGEVILPDPSGPFGNAAVAQARAAGAGPVGDVVIVMANNDEPLMRVIDARMRDRSLRVVTDRAGRRSRLMAGVAH